MSPIIKTLIVVFGGMAVMVVTTVCGAEIGSKYGALWDAVFGGAIGAVVGVPIWVWLGYMACRNKNAAPNEVIPDDSTT